MASSRGGVERKVTGEAGRKGERGADWMREGGGMERLRERW